MKTRERAYVCMIIYTHDHKQALAVSTPREAVVCTDRGNEDLAEDLPLR